MKNLINKLNDLWKKKPQPENPETPVVDTPGNIPWLRVGVLLRSIPFQKLLPLFVTVPAIVFFAISGFVAWIMVVLKFALSVFNMWG